MQPLKVGKLYKYEKEDLTSGDMERVFVVR